MASAVVLLDLDGTVWDSRPWYARTIARLSGCAVSEVEDELDAGASVVRLAKGFGVSRGQFKRAAAANADSLELHEGVPPALDALRARATSVGIVTNLPQWLSWALLRSTGIENHFSAIATPGWGVPAKPQPHGIWKVLRSMGREPDAQTWFVGDEAADASAAAAAGVRFAWASYGYGAEAPPGTAEVLNRFGDVLRL